MFSVLTTTDDVFFTDTEPRYEYELAHDTDGSVAHVQWFVVFTPSNGQFVQGRNTRIPLERVKAVAEQKPKAEKSADAEKPGWMKANEAGQREARRHGSRA